MVRRNRGHQQAAFDRRLQRDQVAFGRLDLNPRRPVEQRGQPTIFLLGKRRQLGVDHQPLAALPIHRKTLDADDQGIHLPPVLGGIPSQFGEPRRLVPRHAAERHIGDRRQAAARAAQRVDQPAVDHRRTAAVGPLAKTGRQKLALDQIGDGLGPIALGPRRPLGQLEQLEIGHRLQAAAEFDLVLGAEQALLKGGRKEHEHRILAAGGHQRPGVAEFAVGREAAAPVADGQEPFDDRPRGCHQMKIAVGHVVRAQAVIRRGQQRHVTAADRHRLQARAAIPFRTQRRAALVGQVPTQQPRVAGLEQHPHRCTFAEKQIATDQRHVGDHGRPQQIGQRRRFQGQLLLHPLAGAIVKAAQRDHPLQVSAVLVLQILEPQVVLEIAEADVKALFRNPRRQGLDLDLRSRRGRRQRLPLDLGGKRLVGCLADPIAFEIRLPQRLQTEPFGAQHQVEHLQRFGTAGRRAAFGRQGQAQAAREQRRQIGLHDRRIIAVLRLLAGRGVVLAPPTLQQPLVASRIGCLPRNQAIAARRRRVEGHIQRLLAGEQKQDVDRAGQRVGRGHRQAVTEDLGQQSAHATSLERLAYRWQPVAEDLAQQPRDPAFGKHRIQRPAIGFGQGQAIQFDSGRRLVRRQRQGNQAHAERFAQLSLGLRPRGGCHRGRQDQHSTQRQAEQGPAQRQRSLRVSCHAALILRVIPPG